MPRRPKCNRFQLRFEALEPRHLLASYSGAAFFDTNENRQFDANERGMDGITVELFSSPDFRASPTDQLAATTVTDRDGNYSFDNLSPGYYFIHIDIQQGISVLTPTSEYPVASPNQIFDHSYNSRPVNLTADASLNIPLTSRHDTLRERVFHDLNGNQRFDPGEPRVTDGRVYYDFNDNGIQDRGESWTQVSSDGRAKILGRPTRYAATREWESASQPLHQNMLMAAQRQIFEVTWDGTAIETTDIPWPTTPAPIFWETVGIAVAADGRRYVQQSSATEHYISVLDPATGEWEHHSIHGLDARRLSIKDDYLYTGHARYYLPNWNRESLEVPLPYLYVDIQVGYDGLRYALYKSTVSGSYADIAIAVLAPDRAEVIRYIPVANTISPSSGLYSFSMNPSGEFFLAHGQGLVYRISPDGIAEDAFYAAAGASLQVGADNTLISIESNKNIGTFDFGQASVVPVLSKDARAGVVAFAEYQGNLPYVADIVTITPPAADIVVERGFFIREPAAIADRYLLTGHEEFSVDAADGVLRNDFDEDGDLLEVTLLVPPSHGSLQLESDGSFRYVPNEGFEGIDRFEYWIRDHWWGVDTGEVTLQVRAQPPQGTVSGIVWRDTDANQIQEGNEGPVSGVPVLLDENQNGIVDPGERTMLTGPDGRYTFTGVLPGEHAVKVLNQQVWEQTFPRGSTNLLIGRNRFVLEYTREGELVQTLPVEYPGSIPASSHPAIVGIKTDTQGNLYVRQGSYLSKYDPLSQTWSHLKVVVDFNSWGRVGQFGISENTIYLGEGTQISLETGAQTYFPFITHAGNPHRFHYGQDGRLYGLLNIAFEVDPVTMVMRDELKALSEELYQSMADLEVGPQGDFWTARDNTGLWHISREMEVLSITPLSSTVRTYDIALSRDGWVAVGKEYGETFIVSATGEVVAQIPLLSEYDRMSYSSVTWKAYPNASYDSHRVTLLEGEVAADLNFGVRRDTMPQAVSRHYEVDEDAVLSIDVESGLLSNGPSNLRVTDVSSTSGFVSWQPNGSFRYSPPANFFGELTFTYVVADELETASGTFTIFVHAVAEPWHNAASPADTNADGYVAPLDALNIIVFINVHGTRQLDSTASREANEHFNDVNGDNFISPLDALLIINALNANTANAEPPPSMEAVTLDDEQLPESSWSLETYFAFELLEETRRR